MSAGPKTLVEVRRLQRAADVRLRAETEMVLGYAVALLERDGWHRGSLRDAQGRRDVLAALGDGAELAAPGAGYAAACLAQDTLVEVLGLPDGGEVAAETRLARWNDGMSDRRAVVRALKRAHKELGGGQG